jgi:hypothetical protein
MKRCPQCEFIYEDYQTLCDMDGRELVYHSAPVAFEGSSTQPLIHIQENPWAAESLSVSGVVAPETPSQTRPAAKFEKRSRRRVEWWKRFWLTAAAVMLGVLVFLVYHSATLQNITNPEDQKSKLEAPSAESTPATPAVTSAPATVNPSSEAIAQDASESAAANVSEEVVTNDAKSANMNPPSGRVRNVKAPSASPAPSHSPSRELAANKPQPENINPPKEPVAKREVTVAPKDPGVTKRETPVAQNQPKAKPEDPKAKKESKVGSFFKKAGRIIKKPFEP